MTRERPIGNMLCSLELRAWYMSAAFSSLALLVGCSNTKSTISDGIEIVYEDSGGGDQTMVLIHGGLSDRTVWSEQIAALESEHRILAVDLPGHGESEKPDRGYTAETFSNAVLAVLDDAGVESAILVGHSFGVSVIRDVARDHPERVAGLAMVDGFLVPLTPNETERQALLSALSSEQLFAETAGDFVDTFMFADSTPDDIRERVRDMMLSAPQHVWVNVLQIATDPAVLDLSPIAIPTLGIFTENPYVPPDYEAFLAGIFEALDFRTVAPGTGHFIMLERSGELSAMLRELAQGR